MITQFPITVYNKHVGPDRRDVFVPTAISAASYSESLGSTWSKESRENNARYKLRIPFQAEIQDDRTFVPEQVFKAMCDTSAYWTLQHLDLVTIGGPVVDKEATEKEIREAAAEAGVVVIVIDEYADNTARGSDAVKHWRVWGR